MGLGLKNIEKEKISYGFSINSTHCEITYSGLMHKPFMSITSFNIDDNRLLKLMRSSLDT